MKSSFASRARGRDRDRGDGGVHFARLDSGQHPVQRVLSPLDAAAQIACDSGHRVDGDAAPIAVIPDKGERRRMLGCDDQRCCIRGALHGCGLWLRILRLDILRLRAFRRRILRGNRCRPHHDGKE